MQGLLPLIGVVILLAVAVFAVKIVLLGFGKGPIAHPYQKEPALFTAAERSFLVVLDQALQGQFRVFGKVRLADVITVKSGLSASARQQAFNRIQSKHLDFVACDPNDFSPQFAVELDDSSHQAPHRQTRDKFIDKALAAAGLPVFHFAVKRTHSVQDIRRVVFDQHGASHQG